MSKAKKAFNRFQLLAEVSGDILGPGQKLKEIASCKYDKVLGQDAENKHYGSLFREDDEETDKWLELLLKIACNV